MKEEKRKAPRLRFSEFEEEWEQRKLGNLVSFSKGSGYSKGDLKENGTPIILYGRLYTKYETVISEVDTFVDEKKGSVYSNGGEVIVPASGETAEDISIASVVEKSGVLLGGDLNVITPPDELDSAFLAISISNGKPHNDMTKMAQGKTVVHLHNKDLARIDFPYPSIKEQRKISGFFSDFDNLITLHKRKLEQMKEYKKGMLQKMFPKKGETVPEVRFPEFEGDWDQYTLGELGFFKNGMNFSKEAMNKGYPFVNLQNIFGHNEVNTEKLGLAEATDTQLKEYNLLRGDTLFVRSSVKLEGVGEAALIPQNLINTTYSGFLIRFRDESNIDYNFKRFLFGIKSVRDQIMSKATNSANKNISQDVLMNLEISLPLKEEQQKIGEYFSYIDNFIALHQLKLEQMKEYKKGLLQQMFV